LDRSLGDFGYVHLATHAVVDEEHPQLSRVELAAVDEQGRPQDGALRLLDIHNLHLNARLVVLSGCDTALGAQVGGEGLVGLASGFLRAGAAAVVASLWPVDDRATEAFMSAFYDELLRRDADPVRALHAAQRAFQRNPRWQAPFDWAGWVLIGAPTRMD
jgi:CHAT domain-containing protein